MMTTLAHLDVIRYDVDGNGVPTVSGIVSYNQAFSNRTLRRWAVRGLVSGYELRNDLDFDENGDGAITQAGDPAYWNSGAGWQPIGDSRNLFSTTFNGNGHTIAHLFINRGSTNNVGLFGVVSAVAG